MSLSSAAKPMTIELGHDEDREARSARSGLLIDLSSIDMTKTALDRAALERWNPHRGPIVQLDRVIWTDAAFSQAVGVKHVRDDEFWVGGHFPGRPMMPGVLMIEAGAQLSSYMFYARRGEPCLAGFTRIDNVAFRGQVVPGDDLILLSRELKFKPRRFVSAIQGVVREKLVFEAEITGMTF
jgi:3-hydroxyacyl-[acyl-carrier-protein] dehydratase